MPSPEPHEYSTAQDAYLNYCLWPYEPLTTVENKFRPVSLLYHSFQLAQIDERAFAVVQGIREAIGPFRTVWGTKLLGDRLAWEFYFYDYRRREREVSVSRVLRAISPWITCDVQVDESLPYFMFSLDIHNDLLCRARKLPEVHMYIGNPGSTLSSGIAYAVRPDQTTLENLYFFFDAQSQLDDAVGKVCCSARMDATKIQVDRILLPELRNCHTICIANKQHSDTAYFSGINVDQLLFFFRMLEYPHDLVKFVEANRNRFDHLLYDVGFDYVAEGDQLRVIKSGYYGLF